MQRYSESDRQSARSVAYWPLMVGKGQDPSGLLDVTMPFDGNLLARVETAGVEHVEQGLDVAYGLFRDRRRWLSLEERIGILERSARIMARMQDVLAMTTSREAGKPLRDSRLEVQHTIDDARLCVVHLRTDAGRVAPTGATRATAHRIALTRYEPAGVVVVVNAFNHPLNVAVHGIFAAVAAGCPVVVVPADAAPLSSLQVAAVLRQAGLPAAWCQVVVAANARTAESLFADARVGMLSFANGAAAGRGMRRRLDAEARRDQEYAGAAPVFVMEEATALSAAASIARAAYYHAGQLSVPTQQVFVPGSFAQEFAGLLAERSERLVVGDPTAVTTDVGPLMRPDEVTRVAAWVDDAVSRGAELLTGGSAIGANLYRPTVLINSPPEAMLSRRQIPGPVIGVQAYEQIDAAIAMANDSGGSVHAAVFTSDLDAALRVFVQLDTSAVTVNDTVTHDPAGMPFLGLGHLARGNIRHTIDGMRRSKMLVVNSQELQ